MSKTIESEVYFTSNEIIDHFNVTSSTLNNAVYRHNLPRILHNGRWYYPQRSFDEYQRIREKKKATKSKNTSPLQNTMPSEPPAIYSSPIEEPVIDADPQGAPGAQSLDPLPCEECEEHEEEAEPANQILEPDFETAMLRLVLDQLNAKIAKEQAKDFIEKLKDIRSGIAAYHAMILALIDNAIAEYEAPDGESSNKGE